MQIDKKDIIQALGCQLRVSNLFTSHLLARDSWVDEDLVDQLFNSSEKCLVRVLLLFANYGPK